MGLVIGNLVDASSSKGLPGFTIVIQPFSDTSNGRTILSDKNGGFEADRLAFGYYRLLISGVGYGLKTIDSLHFRTERFDFNLGDIKLSSQASNLNEVIVYAEKPLIESTDGKITFNVGESALSAGSSTTELLKNMPLISNDAEGKILLKGKEPKILIDDKPTDLNAQQLADLLESLPGSSIEKIELMTNPPPQYANEAGGVINIITKKGKIGMTGRISASYGSRGEGNLSANISYRNKKFSANVSAGMGASRLFGGGNSYRTNIYADSSNALSTLNGFTNKNVRPNLRVSLDYEINKKQQINFTGQFASNSFDNISQTNYTNLNFATNPYRISNRSNHATGSSYNPSFTGTYTLKGKIPGDVLRIFANYNIGASTVDRDYFQQFQDGKGIPTGVDSTQKQSSENNNQGYGLRVNYDKPIKKINSSLSFGGFFNRNGFDNLQNTFFLKKPDNIYTPIPLLSNDFNFTQTIGNLRAGFSHDITKTFKVTATLQSEYTKILFKFNTAVPNNGNEYWSILPSFTVRKEFTGDWNTSLNYRKNIRRAGIDELNPSISYNDPYNLRFGNPYLLPQLADNYDLSFGTYKGKIYGNVSMGYNKVKDIIQRIRTLVTDGKTQTTFNNITDRHEYEASLWGGYTFSRQFRLNASAGYTFNKYSEYDRTINKYRNGGSFYTNLNYNFILTDRVSFDGNLRYNSFADPQGRSRSNLSQNIGMQTKYFNKRVILSINLIDIFAQQQYNTFTTGPNFTVQSINNSNTRNVRVAVSYNLNKNRSSISNKQRKLLIENVKAKSKQ
ncbi:MAG: TonB-dependent receptor [Chitinophagaceae bacterium]